MKKSTAKSDKLILNVESRKIFGKKLNRVRNLGLLPANIYGTDFKSQSISTNLKDFIKTYRVAKETGVIYLTLNKEEIPTLIKNVQRHPVTDVFLHVDFRKIDLAKKIETEVPVKTVGISEAVSQKGGVLLIQTEILLVEALPQDIPHQIEIDVSLIKEIGQEIKVADLLKSDKYQIKTASEKVIVSVIAHKEESVTPETTVAAPEIITEAPEEGGVAETAAPATEEEKTTKLKETAQGKPQSKPETPAEKK